jgi:hypothetical protein
MMLPDEWRCRIIDALAELGDPEFQQRVWIDGRGPEVSPFVEAVSRLMDDYDRLATWRSISAIRTTRRRFTSSKR